MPPVVFTISQQLSHLKDDRNIIISDPDKAKESLERIGYSVLIWQYKKMLKIRQYNKYKPGVQFQDFLDLYEFDKELRDLFLHYFLQIELHIKSLIIQEFSQKIGPCEYLNPSKFQNPQSHEYLKLSQQLNEALKKCTMSNGPVPIWILFNQITLGNLAYFYKLAPGSVRNPIMSNFPVKSSKHLEAILFQLADFRNTCAHNQHLFDHYFKVGIQPNPLYGRMGIPMIGNTYSKGINDLFGAVVSMRIILSKDDFNEFWKNLKKIVDHYLQKSTQVSENELLEEMGFPRNWKNLPRYKLK